MTLKVSQIHSSDFCLEKGLRSERALNAAMVEMYIQGAKFVDYLPLYRQKQQFQRHGITVAASTMCDWVNTCAATLKPLYNELKNFVLNSDYLNVDDTPIDLLRKKEKKRQARLWLARTGSGPPGMFFHFSEDWTNKQAKNIFKHFNGYLQSDGYSGYLKIGQRPDVTPLGCWAHVRRKFVEAAKLKVRDVDQFVTLINLLYRIEHRIAELPESIADADKLALRQKRANRVLNRFFA